MNERSLPPDLFPAVPDIGDDPVNWDARGRRFVPRPDGPKGSAAGPSGGARDERRFYVGPDAVGKAPPPRAGGLAAPPRREAPAGPKRIDVPPPKDRAHGPAPARQPLPVPAPAKAPTPARRRRRSRRKILIVALLLPVLLGMAGFLWANWKFSQIERVEVGQALSAAGGGGTNYLIVGSDSREGTGMEGPGGQRSDTMMVLRIEPDRSVMLSIPRDLYVTHADGDTGRINGAYNDGPVALVETVKQSLGIPVHRYLEVDFVTFAGLVDAMGGVTIDFPNPAYDEMSGLAIDQTGPVELNGEQALAYVRSRQYTEIIDGRPVTDPTADLGRVVRQQAFLRTVLGKLGDSRNPISLMRAASSVASGIRIDDKMSMVDAMRFAWRMKGLEPDPLVLPTRGDRIGGASVLLLIESEAGPVLDQLR